MNNRKFIRVSVWSNEPYQISTIMDWEDYPKLVTRSIRKTLSAAIDDLGNKRGALLKKLYGEDEQWFKDNIKNDTFGYSIEVYSFGNSFDSMDDFKQWAQQYGIQQYDSAGFMIPLSYTEEERKKIVEEATLYAVDYYDIDLNIIDSLSVVYNETEPHRRTGVFPKFNIGDHVSYDGQGDYTVIGYEPPFSSIYWHDGFIVTMSKSGYTQYSFDNPDLIKLIKSEEE